MNLSRTTIGIAFSLLFAFAACSKKDNSSAPKPALQIPDTYDSVGYAANVSQEMTIRRKLNALVNELKRGRNASNTINKTDLLNLYTSGSPSLQSFTTAYYQPIVEAHLEKAADASGNTFIPSETISGKGGVFDGVNASSSYLFDETGFEMEQIVEKGLFSALMYNHALSIIQSGLTESSVDRLVCIWGASPLFPNTNTAANTSMPDAYSALYAARRDKNDGNGLYTSTRDAFIKLKAAVRAGDAYKTEQEEAINIIKENWEKALFATIINYCYSAIGKISATSPTDADRASALHALSEAAGFAHGWKTISDKKITDTQIDAILAALGAPTGNSGSSTFYQYITNPYGGVTRLDNVINQIQSIYGFSAADLADFRENWINKQSR